jgi:hypothetical protein
MNKQQRQARRGWIQWPSDGPFATVAIGFIVDRDPDDEHDPDGTEEHREYMASLAAGAAARNHSTIQWGS